MPAGGEPLDCPLLVGAARRSSGCGGGGCNVGSFPLGAWEPGDRGGAPPHVAAACAPGPCWGVAGVCSGANTPPLTSSALGATPKLQLDALAERVGSVVVGLQRQCETERRSVDRRFQQIELELQGAMSRLEGVERKGDRLWDNDYREKFAEIQGSVSGLVDESQALARRLDGMDERLWARTSGTEELARQGARELGQQLQAFERQTRLAAASAEETQKRQAGRQRRAEHLLEDLAWRLAKAEEEVRRGGERGGGCDAAGQRDAERAEAHLQTAEIRLRELGAEVDVVGARLEAVEARIAAGTAGASAGGAGGAAGGGGGSGGAAADACIEPASAWPRSSVTSVEGLERDLEVLERRMSAQLEELAACVASMRVKVDGQVQRQNSLADRIETAHLPVLEELAQAQTRELRAMEGHVAEAGQRAELAIEGLADKVDCLERRVAGGEAAAVVLRREADELRAALARGARGVRCVVGPGIAGPGIACAGSCGLGGLAGASAGAAAAAPRQELLAPAIQEQLGAVADQLEVLDDLASRVQALEAAAAPTAAQRRVAAAAAAVAQSSETGHANRPLTPAPDIVVRWSKLVAGFTAAVAAATDNNGEGKTALFPPSAAYQDRPLPEVDAAAQPNFGQPPAAPCGAGALPQPLRTTALPGEPRDKLLGQANGWSSAAASTPHLLLSRRPSTDSQLSCDIAVGVDENVQDVGELQSRCDATEDIIRPRRRTTALRPLACAFAFTSSCAAGSAAVAAASDNDDDDRGSGVAAVVAAAASARHASGFFAEVGDEEGSCGSGSLQADAFEQDSLGESFG